MYHAQCNYCYQLFVGADSDESKFKLRGHLNVDHFDAVKKGLSRVKPRKLANIVDPETWWAGSHAAIFVHEGKGPCDRCPENLP